MLVAQADLTGNHDSVDRSTATVLHTAVGRRSCHHSRVRGCYLRSVTSRRRCGAGSWTRRLHWHSTLASVSAHFAKLFCMLRLAGKWTVQQAAELSVPSPTIEAALDGRFLSGLKDQRVKAAAFYEKYGVHAPSAPSVRTRLIRSPLLLRTDRAVKSMAGKPRHSCCISLTADNSIFACCS